MSRRPNRSAERGPKECQRLGLPPRQLWELMDPSGEATSAPRLSLRSSRARSPDWRDRESIRAEFEARETAGGRPSKRPAVRGSACGCERPDQRKLQRKTRRRGRL